MYANLKWKGNKNYFNYFSFGGELLHVHSFHPDELDIEGGIGMVQND